MDPRAQFCHSVPCRADGERGVETIRLHSWRERRYRCTVCGGAFAQTKATPLYRAHVAAERIVLVLTLLAHGSPLPAIVAALGDDERTVRAWLRRAGQHGERVHEHLVEAGRVERGVVQADEIGVKKLGRKDWRALALGVPSRLWLGGEIGPRRDEALMGRVVGRVRAAARDRRLRRRPRQQRDGLRADFPRGRAHRSAGPPAAGPGPRRRAGAGRQAAGSVRSSST